MVIVANSFLSVLNLSDAISRRQRLIVANNKIIESRHKKPMLNWSENKQQGLLANGLEGVFNWVQAASLL